MPFIIKEIERPAVTHFKDYKTMLQEIVQQNSGEKLEYVLVEEKGPDHDKHFSQIIEAELSKNQDVIISQKDACRLPQALLTHPKLHITIQMMTITNRTIAIIHRAINKPTEQPH